MPSIGKRPATKRVPVPNSRLLRWVRYHPTFAVIVTLISVGVVATLVWSVLSAASVAAYPDSYQHWGENTGPIGDTFGGLFGPILNTLVLGVTVYIAVVWQPDREQRQKADGVVAWLASSNDADEGIVVTNSSGAVATEVGVYFMSDDGTVELALWEQQVPPGEWFIPYRLKGDASKAPAWRYAVNVDHEQMSVSLDDPETDGGRNVVLRPAASNRGGRHDYLLLTLFGRSWRSDRLGITPSRKLSASERADRDKFASLQRADDATTSQPRDVESVIELMKATINRLCGRESAFEDALESPQIVTHPGFPEGSEVVRLRRQKKSFAITLPGPSAYTVRLMGSGDIFPWSVWITDKSGAEVGTAWPGHDSYLNHFAREAAVKVLGGDRVGDLRRPAKDLLVQDRFDAWIRAVQAIVQVAADGPEKTAPTPPPGAAQ